MFKKLFQKGRYRLQISFMSCINDSRVRKPTEEKNVALMLIYKQT